MPERDTLSKAVETAAKARYEDTFCDPDDESWDEIDPAERADWIDVARVALAAALPVVLADLADQIEAAEAPESAYVLAWECGRDDAAELVRRFAADLTGEAQQ